MTIRDGVISNTHGTDPQAGIDLEPNDSTEFLQNIIIENLTTKLNTGYGIDIYLGKYSPNGASVTIKNYSDQNNIRGGISDNFIKYMRDPVNHIIIEKVF